MMERVKCGLCGVVGLVSWTDFMTRQENVVKICDPCMEDLEEWIKGVRRVMREIKRSEYEPCKECEPDDTGNCPCDNGFICEYIGYLGREE